MRDKPLTGFDKSFLEIEAWIRMERSVRYKVMKALENEPLLLVFEEGVDQVHFFINFLEYHRSISEKENVDHLVSNFGSLGGPFAMTSHALYSMSNRLRELFNLTHRVSLNEHDLRKYFSYILSLASDRLARQVTVDSDILLFLESIDLMRDELSQVTAKCWLPKTFVRRIKCIMSCKSSTADTVMSRFPCHRILVRCSDAPCVTVEKIWKPYWTEDLKPDDTILELQEKSKLARIFDPPSKNKSKSSRSFQTLSKDSKERELPPAEYNNKIIETFKELPRSLQDNIKFAETYFGLFLQHPAKSLVDSILTKESVNINRIKSSHMQFAKLKKVEGYSDLLGILVMLYAAEVSAATSVMVITE